MSFLLPTAAVRPGRMVWADVAAGAGDGKVISGHGLKKA
jgi:hypothetical protein